MHLKGREIEKLKKSGVEVCTCKLVFVLFSYIVYVADFNFLLVDHRHYIVSRGGLYW